MLRVLRQRNYCLLLVAGVISLIGDWALGVALPITVFQLTHSTLAMGAAFTAELLPQLLLSSVAGVLVDRWDRRRVMIACDLVLAAGLLPLLLVRSAGWVWIVYLVTLGQSLVTRFFSPAENALLPTLVLPEDLVSANSLDSVANNAARLVGPALGGLIAVSTGLVGVTLIDSASFLLAAALIAAVQAPVRPAVQRAGREASAAWRKVWREWLDGLTAVRDNRTVAIFLAVWSITGFGEAVMGVMFVVWIKESVHGSALQLGWFMSAQAIGGLLGGMVIALISRRLPTLLLAWVGPIVFGLIDMALFSYPLAFSQIWVGLALIALVGLPASALSASWMTLLQTGIQDEFRGRVFGALGTTQGLMMLAGTAVAGVSGGAVSPILFLVVAQGGGYVVAGVIVLLMLGRPLLSLPTRARKITPTDERETIAPGM